MKNATYLKFTIIWVLFCILIFPGCVTQSANPLKLAEKSRQLLHDQIKNGPRMTREAIVRLTGGMAEEEAIPILEIALKDPEKAIVEKAIEKLVEFKSPLAIPEKKAKLGNRFDPDEIAILVDLGAKDIDANFEVGLTNENEAYRARAVELLGKYKGKDAEERLRTFLTDTSPIVVLKAKTALARIGDTEVLKGLDEYLIGEDSILRLAAMTLIGEKDLREYRDKIFDITKLSGEISRMEALRLLYKWDDPEAIKIVDEEIKGSVEILDYPLLKDIEEKKDKSMIPALREAMSSSLPHERYSAARVAVTIDPDNTKEILDFILKGLESEHDGVREQVAVSLSQLPGIPIVKRKLETAGVKDKSLKVRNASIISLGKIGDSQSLIYLAPLLEDDIFDIRATAAAAILNIINRKNLPGKVEKKKEEKPAEGETEEK